MAIIVYTTADRTSLLAASAFGSGRKAELLREGDGFRVLAFDQVRVVEVTGRLIAADFLDQVAGGETILFMSKHSSREGILSFTVHPLGNWSEDHRDGGKPRELGCAAPVEMLAGLAALAKNRDGVRATYEATHHGPLLKAPALFMEVGGPQEIPEALAGRLGELVSECFGIEPEYDKVALGIGGGHYPQKFTKLALEGKYAFSHMMPKHHCGEVEMLAQAVERSAKRPELAVIEWKSVGSERRSNIIRKLGELGLEHVRV